MKTTAKPANNLAKSLHTISVLLNLGWHLYETREGVPTNKGPKALARGFVNYALVILGHADKEDSYGLAEIAATQLAARIAHFNKEEVEA